MSSKAWGGVGAWALDAERAEAEERERADAEGPAAGFPTLGEAAANPQSFPSLKEAVATKPKKKKPVALSLSEFKTGAYVGPGGGARRDLYPVEPKGLTHDEMLHLPTGPRERSEEELQYGRGFRSYGYGTGPSGSREGPSRRSYGGFDDEPRRGPPPRAASDLDQPSRADEVDNWAATKKPLAPSRLDSAGRDDRYGSFGGGPSRADEVDNWAAGKKSMPSRHSGFGSGFRDSPASDSDRWVQGVGVSVPRNGEQRERPRLVLDPPKESVRPVAEPTRSRPSLFGAGRPREEVLAGKGLDWKKMDTEIELKRTTSRPTSAHSSRPSSAQSSRPGSPGSLAGAAEGAPRARPRVSPFGDAKPREVLLEEKGMDWRKIDMELEHRRVDRAETVREKTLQEEIDNLKSVVKDIEGSLNGGSSEELTALCEQIRQRESELERLVHELDDKVRFGQKSTGDMRPGSGAGRMVTSLDRPPSQSGMSEDSRRTDFMERPRSRGAMRDAWSKPMDDGRGFQSGRERVFFGNRSMDRSQSRERW